MSYGEYTRFCRLMGYRAQETPHGIWIGPSHGLFNRVPLYETAPPTKDELRTLFRRHPVLGVHYAAESGSRGRSSHNYFVRDPNYSLMTLKSKGRWSVRKGLRNCQVRPIEFDELHCLGVPCNQDSLQRQGRDDPLISDPGHWACLCRAGADVEPAEAWGAFVGDELAAYIVFIRTGCVANLLYHSSRTSLMHFHPSSALFFTLTQTLMQTPGIEAVYNGPEWLTTTQGLDRFKQRMGFNKEPVAFVVRLRPVVARALFDWSGRRVIDAVGHRLSDNDLYRQVQAVLDTAALSLE